MAEYYKLGNIHGAKIRIFPSKWYKRLFKWFPIFVGQNIEFDIEFEKLDNFNVTVWNRSNIIEKFPERELGTYHLYKLYQSEEKCITKTIRSTYKVSREGDIEYRICESNFFQRGTPIFSAHIISKDRISLFFYGTAFGAIVTLIVNLIWKFFSK